MKEEFEYATLSRRLFNADFNANGNVERMAFKLHLKKVAKALKFIEWNHPDKPPTIQEIAAIRQCICMDNNGLVDASIEHAKESTRNAIKRAEEFGVLFDEYYENLLDNLIKLTKKEKSK